MAENKVNLTGVQGSNYASTTGLNPAQKTAEGPKTTVEFNKDTPDTKTADGLKVSEGPKGTPEEREARAAANQKAVEEMNAMKEVAAQSKLEPKQKMSPEMSFAIEQTEKMYYKMGEMNYIIRYSGDPDRINYAKAAVHKLQQDIGGISQEYLSGLSPEMQDLLRQAENNHYQMGEIAGVLRDSTDQRLIDYARVKHNELQQQTIELHRQIF